MAGLGGLLGCGEQPVDNGDVAAAPAPRANLYPLTSPPPGSVQPLRGYAPTRLPALSEPQYGPEIYRDGLGNVELAARNTGALSDAAYSTGSAALPPAPDFTDAYAGDAYAGDPYAGQTAFAAAPAAPLPGADTYPAVQYPDGFVVTQPAVYTAAATPPAGYMTAAAAAAASVAAGYDPSDPSSPYYCPPGAAYCPIPGSALNGAPVVATPADTFGLESPAAPSSLVATYAAPEYATTAYTAAPAYTTVPATAATTYAVAPAAYTPPAAQTVAAPLPAPAPAARYTPPLRLSASARLPASPSPSAYERNAPRGLHFGEAEGTADIVGPVPSPSPIVRPAYAAPYPAPAYGAPYPARPLSLNAEPEAAPAPAPAMAALPAPAPAPARRPMLSSAPGAQPAAGEPQSAVAGVAAARGGYRLVPAPDVPPGNHPGDFGPSQWFEVVRPGNGPVRVGRLSVTCTCVGARIPKRHYGAGERILVEARMISKPARNNLTYGLYVNILEPVETVVDADVTLTY